MFELAVDGASVFFLLQRFAFVKAVLASCQIDVKLSSSVLVYKQKGRDDGESGTLGGLLKSAYLTAIQEKFTVTAGCMVIISAIEVGRYVHVLNPYLAMEYDAVSVYQACLAEADAFDLRPCQYQTGSIFIHQIIIEFRFAVLDIDGLLFLFCHN